MKSGNKYSSNGGVRSGASRKVGTGKFRKSSSALGISARQKKHFRFIHPILNLLKIPFVYICLLY